MCLFLFYFSQFPRCLCCWLQGNVIDDEAMGCFCRNLPSSLTFLSLNVSICLLCLGFLWHSPQSCCLSADAVISLADSLKNNENLNLVKLHMMASNFLKLPDWMLTLLKDNDGHSGAALLRVIEWLDSNNSVEQIYFFSNYQIAIRKCNLFTSSELIYIKGCLKDNYSLTRWDLQVTFLPLLQNIIHIIYNLLLHAERTSGLQFEANYSSRRHFSQK